MAPIKLTAQEAVTQQDLHRLFNYDSNTGFFWRNIKVSSRCDLSIPAGTLKSTGYIEIRVFYLKYLAHRLAWLYVHGVWPVEQIDHINGLRSDNRIVNLRLATRGQNQRNYKKPKNNTSGYKGVVFSLGGWNVSIKYNGKTIYVGRYATREEGFVARCEMAKKLHGDFWSPG